MTEETTTAVQTDDSAAPQETVILGQDDLKECSISELLEVELDCIEDMAEFVLPPIGSYHIDITKCELGIVGDAMEAIILETVLLDTIELKNSTDKPVADGTTLGLSYPPGFGLQKFTTTFGEAGKALGATNVRELIEVLNGASIVGTLGHRSKKEKNVEGKVVDIKYYPDLKAVVLA